MRPIPIYLRTIRPSLGPQIIIVWPAAAPLPVAGDRLQYQGSGYRILERMFDYNEDDPYKVVLYLYAEAL